MCVRVLGLPSWLLLLVYSHWPMQEQVYMKLVSFALLSLTWKCLTVASSTIRSYLLLYPVLGQPCESPPQRCA